MREQINAVCDICGAPATNAAYDTIRGVDLSGAYRHSRPGPGPKHLGCEAHPARERVTVYETNEIIGGDATRG